MDIHHMHLQPDAMIESIVHNDLVPSYHIISANREAPEAWDIGEECLAYQAAYPEAIALPTECSNTVSKTQDTQGFQDNESGLCTTKTSQVLTRATPWAKRKTRCLICGLEILKKTLQRHIRDKHVLEKSWLECAACEAKFKRWDTLSRHVAEQHGESRGEAGAVECAYCHQIVRERAFNEHLKSRKCVKAKDMSSQPGTAAHFEFHPDVLDSVPRSWFGLESIIDPEMSITFALAALLLIEEDIHGKTKKGHLGIINLASSHQRYLREFWNFRGLAIRSIQSEQRETSNKRNAQFLLRWELDRVAFNEPAICSVAHESAYREYWQSEAHITFLGFGMRAYERLAETRQVLR